MSSDNPYASSTSFENSSNVLQGDSSLRNVAVEISDILNYAFKVWKENLGLLVLSTLVIFAISFGLGIVQSIAQMVIQGGPNNEPSVASIAVAQLIGLVNNVIQVFLGIGNLRIVLALLRNQPASLNMLFSGGDRLLPTIGFSILFGIAVVLGMLLLIVPGVILLLLFWPAYYLIIDRRTPVFQSFGLAREITRGNILTGLMMGLLSFGIMIIGLLACLIGILFAQPLSMLIFACGYLMMSGQLNPKAAQSAA